MTARIVELRQQRKATLDKARALQQKAESESRDLTPYEKSTWDGYMSELDGLKGRIERADTLRDIDGEMDCYQSRTGGHREGGLPVRTQEDRDRRGYRYDEALEWRGSKPENNAVPLNMAKWLRGIATGDWTDARAEMEATRAMSVGTSSTGGVFVPEVLSANIINLARNKARVMRAGALSLPMEDSGEMTMVKVTGDPTAYWKVENADATESSMTFGALRFRARTLVALVKSSYETIADGSRAKDTVSQALANVLALELDRAGLYGTGAAEQPLGLYNWDDVKEYSMGTNGAALSSYNPFSHAVQEVLEANAEDTSLAAIYAPRTAGELDRLVDGQSRPLTPPASFAALKRYVTNQVSIAQTQGSAANASDAFVGDFRQMVFAIRQGVTIAVTDVASDADGNSAFTKMQVWIRAHMRVDVGVLQPEHFCIIKGIIPAS